MTQEARMPRKAWDLAFAAEPATVAALRRVVRLQLGLWGLRIEVPGPDPRALPAAVDRGSEEEPRS